MMKNLLLIPLLLAVFTVSAAGQTTPVKITGTVHDNNGNSISGAHVYIEGTTTGAASRPDGTFVINNVPSGSHILIASHILYEPERISVTIKDGDSIDLTIVFKTEIDFNLSEVVVTATKFETEPEKVPQSVTLITKEEVEKGNYYNAGEMLDSVPGVRVIRSGTVGASCGISIRSLNGGPLSTKSLVMVDGRPLNDGWQGGVNWHSVPTEIVERIEVVKGPASALYGSNATGGVINVITKTPRRGFHGWFSAGYEMDGSKTIDDAAAEGYGRSSISATNFQLNGSYGTAKTGHLISLGYRKAYASFPVPNENRWKNYDIKYKINHRFSESLSSRLSIDIHNDTWRNEAEKSPDENSSDFYGADFFAKYQGLSGILTGRVYMNYLENKDEVLATNLKTGSKAYRLGFITDYTINFYDHNAALQFGIDSYFDQADVEDEQTVMEMEYLGINTIYMTDNKTGQVSAVQAETYSGTYGLNSQDYNQSNAALFVQYSKNFSKRLSTILGGRLDFNSVFGTVFSPKASMTLDLFEIYGVASTLKINYGTGFRAPPMLSLFSKSLGGYGDEDLIPEKTKNFDIGIFGRLGDVGHIEVTYFKMDVDNLLINDKAGQTGEGYWVLVPDGGGAVDTLSFNQRKNLGDYQPSGLEVGFKIKPVSMLTLSGGYTYLDPGDFTFQTSKNRFNFGINYSRPVGNNKIEAEIQRHYTGDGYFFDYESRPYDAFSIIDGRISFTFHDLFRVSLHGKNIADKNYRLWHYTWQPGRTFVLQIDTRF